MSIPPTTAKQSSVVSSPVCFHCGTPCGIYSPTKNYKLGYHKGEPYNFYEGSLRENLSPTSLSLSYLESPVNYDEWRPCEFVQAMDNFFGSKWKNYYKLAANPITLYFPIIVRRDNVTPQQALDAYKPTIIKTFTDSSGQIFHTWGVSATEPI